MDLCLEVWGDVIHDHSKTIKYKHETQAVLCLSVCVDFTLFNPEAASVRCVWDSPGRLGGTWDPWDCLIDFSAGPMIRCWFASTIKVGTYLRGTCSVQDEAEPAGGSEDERCGCLVHAGAQRAPVTTEEGRRWGGWVRQ